MIWAIGDVHGCLKTLKALVEKIRRQDEDADIHLLGDLIDRGPASLEVLHFARAENFKVIMGNHELMALEHHHHSPLKLLVDCDWESNGGNSILNKDIQTYLSKLPFYIHYPDVMLDGKSLFLSHSCLHKKAIEVSSDKEKIEICWNRRFNRLSNFIFEGSPVYCIFGHTEQLKVMETDSFACIDTGCVYGTRPRKVYGTLTAMSFPGREIVQQKLLDFTKKETAPSKKRRVKRVKRHGLHRHKFTNHWGKSKR